MTYLPPRFRTGNNEFSPFTPELSASYLFPQVRENGIWTQHFPEPSAASVPRSKRSTSLLETLVQLLELPFPADSHATVCQLAAGLCWNMVARDRALQALFVQHLGQFALRRIAGNTGAPAGLRSIAMGALLASPLEDPRVLDSILVSFVYSGSEQLETVGARGIAFLTQSGDRHGKTSLAQAGAVTALCALLRKQLNRGAADASPEVDAAGEPDLKDGDLTGVSEEGHLATLMALLNLSTESHNQVEIGAKGLTALVRARKAAKSDLAAQVISGTLSNLTLHPGNATRMYRMELKEKAAAAARVRAQSPQRTTKAGAPVPGQMSQASQLAQSMRKARAEIWLNPHNPGGAVPPPGSADGRRGQSPTRRERVKPKAGVTLTQKGVPLAAPWNPPVREYVQVSEKVTSAANKLLLTERPGTGAQRLGETMNKLSLLETQDTLLVEGGKAERPPMPTPQNNKEILLTTTSARPEATAWRPLTVMSAALDGAAADQKLPLQVVVAPAKPRHVVSFKPRWDRPKGLKLCMWEHVPGSRLYEGLYNPFTLPNGKQARRGYCDMIGASFGDDCSAASRPAVTDRSSPLDLPGGITHDPDADIPPVPITPQSSPNHYSINTDLLLHGGVRAG